MNVKYNFYHNKNKSANTKYVFAPRRTQQNTFCLPTFLCFLYHWPPASRAEDSRWERKRCPPEWGCLSFLPSYHPNQEGHMCPYLKPAERSLNHVALPDTDANDLF